jgi:hypothetical protein
MELTIVVECIKRKTVPLTGHGGPQGCERSRLSHFLDSRLTDGSESLTAGPEICRDEF